MTEEFKKKLRQIVEEGVYTDWCWNGEDEVRVDAYDNEQVVRNIVSLIEETYEKI